jgi:hypothetical protein
MTRDLLSFCASKDRAASIFNNSQNHELYLFTNMLVYVLQLVFKAFMFTHTFVRKVKSHTQLISSK